MLFGNMMRCIATPAHRRFHRPVSDPLSEPKARGHWVERVLRPFHDVEWIFLVGGPVSRAIGVLGNAVVGVSKILTYTILHGIQHFLRIHGYLHTSDNATIRLLMAAAAFAWHSTTSYSTL